MQIVCTHHSSDLLSSPEGEMIELSSLSRQKRGLRLRSSDLIEVTELVRGNGQDRTP